MTAAGSRPPEGRSALLIGAAARAGGLARGALETVRALERGTARAVFLATDIDRPGLAEKLRELCRRGEVPLVERHLRSELGEWAGIERPCASLAVTRLGDPEAFVAALLDGAPALVRSIGGLQRLAAPSLATVDPAAAIRAAADAVESAEPRAIEQAVAGLLRATLALAAHHQIDLQELVDRWSLRDWLQAS